MALYLGNQKVSLRSGQDPTFDYGFDSNGRLVFANKNATEINNFLNYDSTYSEILDLSNLSKMEKVAVNGTADRKMEGLKGLLVSPNAPFTGSSPQINASYTGLNKSALVSLFESVPYNVGYTKVGNPTIVDGVASGFSSSDYLNISSFPNLNVDFTSQVVFTSNADSQVAGLFCCANWNYNGWHLVNGLYFSLRVSDGENSKIIRSIFTTQLLSGTSYKAVAVRVGNNIVCNLYLGDTKIEEHSFQVDTGYNVVQDIYYRVGYSAPGSFNGSIDLNETYIKVNRVPWFTGKPAMTKTCSIVGATGTADLTQEDKNIILNKGWSLTVQ